MRVTATLFAHFLESHVDLAEFLLSHPLLTEAVAHLTRVLNGQLILFSLLLPSSYLNFRFCFSLPLPLPSRLPL